MSDQALPEIQGIPTSWANLTTKIRGTDFTFSTGDVMSISWEDEVEDDDAAYGHGPLPRFRPEGRYNPGEVEMGIYHSAAIDFMAALSSAAVAQGLVNKVTNVPKIALVQFDLQLDWEPYDGVEANQRNVLLEGLRLKKRGMDLASDDGKVIAVPMTFSVMRIETDGYTLLG